MKRMGVVLLLLAVAVATIVAACGGDDDDDTEAAADVEATLDRIAGADSANPEDVDFFLDHITDDLLESFFGFTKDECRQNADDCIGEPSPYRIEDVDVSGNQATANLLFLDDEEEGGPAFGFEVTMVNQDGAWVMSGLEAIAEEIPEGVRAVDLDLLDYSFRFDESAVNDGEFAFRITNSGDELHEAALFLIPDDADLEELATTDEEPEDVEFIHFAGPFGPGQEGTMVFPEALPAGRYALLCFIPDADGVQHTELGMYADFTVE